METYLIYIGKSALAAGSFYLTFLLLFQNQKHFKFNRIYLPVSLALSFIIPLITFTTVKQIEPSGLGANSFAYLAPAAEESTQQAFVWVQYLFGLYILGTAGFLFHLLLGHFKAISIVKKSRVQKICNNPVNITQKDVHPFSFFSKIVLSEKTLTHPNLEMIVSHESIHVREKHTLDILFTEIMFLLQWFNPFAWLLKDAVKNNLEYTTDDEIAKHYNPQTYQLAMVTLADKEGIAPFLTALNGSQLKNRIIMMKKKTENKYALLKQLVVLPLLAILVMGLSNKEVKTNILKSDAADIQSVQSANNFRINTDTIAKSGSQSKGIVIAKSEIVTNSPSAQNGLKIRTTDDQAGQPLYVVDGVETTNIDEMLPENIAQIDVLKKESSTAVYGEKGKNGVILITTKKNSENGENAKNEEIAINKSKYNAEKADPLILVNGKETGKKVNDIDPETIQSISVLKEESATKKHGEKGKNGVIEITLKNAQDSDEATTALKLRRFIAGKIKYPLAAQQANAEDIVQIFAKVNGNGVITDVSENGPDNSLLLDEVVVVAYKNKDDVEIKSEINDPSEQFKAEVKRVIKLLPEIENPELQGKTLGFTVKFMLQEHE